MKIERKVYKVRWLLNSEEFESTYYTRYHAEQIANAIRDKVDSVCVEDWTEVWNKATHFSETFKEQLDYLKERGD